MTLTASSPPTLDQLNTMIGELRQTLPFLYVDKVCAVSDDLTEILGAVTFAHPERYLPPSRNPLLIEALAQLSSLLLRNFTNSRAGGVLASVEDARWLGTLDPHTPAELSVRIHKISFPLFSLTGTVRQNGEILSIVDFTTRSNAGDPQ
ncbi:hypothetical protein OS190_13250 [Sulfitobacter sp. F26204]|uniref:hypothetical protein n=1 Tax=Sulfitobacter sp. F26204 TaxID=2996014 RepID=UPI00225DF8B0|nr:hypothetical protein [Sulfitobacter sp. F26204]MCX7560537.1 hypothetical protein [Sulfitobacter sp. F26204]